jgi:6-phosphogluconolactonase
MRSILDRRSRALVVVLGVILVTVLAWAGPASARRDRRSSGAVFTLSNDPAGNAVVMFRRAADGTVSPAGSVPTGGLGTGAGLGSQGALIMSEGGRWLLGVNAGSDDVSVFAVFGRHLFLTDVEPSGGDLPISLTVHRGLVYVLNDGTDDLSGFRLTPFGRLRPIEGSTIELSGPGVEPAQVEFTPDGKQVVVTEKNTNLIDTYDVRRSGRLSGPVVNPSAGATPFGFAFDPRGRLIVSEAFGGAVDASAMSSYRLRGNGSLRTISASVGTGQTAACWVVVTPNGRFTYTTNTGSNSVSGYEIGRGGTLTLFAAPPFPTGGGPLDMALVRGDFLYTLDGASAAISAFEIEEDGSLSSIGGASGLPSTSVGLVAK